MNAIHTFHNLQLIRFLPSCMKGFLPFFTGLAQRHGDLIYFRLRNKHLIFINHPVHLKHVLQTNASNYRRDKAIEDLEPLLGKGLFMSSGADWQRQRLLIQEAFDRRHFEDFSRIITHATADTVERWTAYTRKREPIDIDLEMRRLTLRILFQTMFSREFRLDVDRVNRSLTTILEYVSLKNYTPRLAWHMIGQLARRNGAGSREVRKALDILDETVAQTIHECRYNGAPPGTLIEIFLRASDAQDIDERQIRDELMNMFFAGYETVSTALTWIWYLLARHPEIENALFDEIHQRLDGRNPDMNDLTHLRYMQQVTQESMRLYPPVWAFFRVANEPDHLDGHPVPEDASIMICPYTLHRHRKLWTAPDIFNPSRFQDASGMRFLYIPFGDGPHTCIGQHLAMAEIQHILAMVMQRFRLSLATDRDVKPAPRITIQPQMRIYMTLDVRS